MASEHLTTSRLRWELKRLARVARRGVRAAGWDIVRYPAQDMQRDAAFGALLNEVRDYTMTSTERVFALREAIRYVSRASIPGAIVECGVWRGGSMMAVALTLLETGDHDRDLFLFDTFSGMTEPGELDERADGVRASDLMSVVSPSEELSVWATAGEESVRAAMASTGYLMDRVHLVRGPVEKTVPDSAPGKIALLRLDTDWYSSTRHELEHLFPRIVPGGVLLLDDYGIWAGARRAVDEYFAENEYHILLNRIDNTGRVGIVCPRESLPSHNVSRSAAIETPR